ncbi:MAG: choice-of-anchor D domain-containing protein [Phycisphaerales bacterium]|nr:MAG: choice-of-anchor D domain-containing protein [Phycisphaerales bacterium]
MKKSDLISTSLMIMIFMLWLSVPTTAYADTLEVLPTDHDFGDVEVGTTATTIVSMTNINGSNVQVFGLGFQAGGSDAFSMVNAPPVPFIVVPGQTVEVKVAFAPSAAGYVSAVLQIESTDSLTPVHEVFLSGVGVDTQPEPVTIQAILDFFDASVAAGTIQGRGHRPRLKRIRLMSMRGMLVAAGKFIETERIGVARRVLKRAYKRCDGEPWPPDFIIGEACPQLADMILDLRESLSVPKALCASYGLKRR